MLTRWPRMAARSLVLALAAPLAFGAGTAGTAPQAPQTTPAAQATGWRALVTDPEDGRFDMSNWLLRNKGFLPVPMIITEPAVGYGGGLGVIFFHPNEG